MKISRRTVTAGILGSIAAAAAPLPAFAGVRYGEEKPFSFEWLTAQAEDLAHAPYKPVTVQDKDLIDRIDYDAYQQIRFRPEESLWANGPGYPVELFHVGRYFQEPARIFTVKDGKAREIMYAPELFSYGKSDFARNLPSDIGFAGFRVMTAKGEPDWLAFLGASYFRTPGETRQYGLSARGLAIDTGLPTLEEFPRFISFWLEPLPEDHGPQGMIAYALLNSKSVAGAYKITTRRGEGVVGVTMDVEAKLFGRAGVQRLGIAPLTSMYWYSKLNHRQATDWRPEIHDSDGLAIWTSADERIWRPLNNPQSVQTSSFFDSAPKGFGLLQRERRFECYEDDGVFYNLRPSVWIEPQGDWGEGAVQLVEIPTTDEIHDNIVAYWVPKEPFNAGGTHTMQYRMHWRTDEPFPARNGRVVATRFGDGGNPGTKPLAGFTKYVIDFAGGILPQLARKDNVEVKLTVRGGTIERKVAYPVLGTDRWRAIFDFSPPDRDPVDMRLFLARNGEALTETWIYQHLSSGDAPPRT
jgi:glucans biosynthesis protein